MTKEDLIKRLTKTMVRKRDLGIKQVKAGSTTHELPILFSDLEKLVIRPEDWRLLKRHSLTMIKLISEIALGLGMDRVASEDPAYIAWDVSDLKPPTPFGESKIQFTHKPVTVINGIPEKHGRGHGPDDLYVDPTYTIKDA